MGGTISIRWALLHDVIDAMRAEGFPPEAKGAIVEIQDDEAGAPMFPHFNSDNATPVWQKAVYKAFIVAAWCKLSHFLNVMIPY